VTGAKLSIWRSVVTGYRDASRALWAMPAVAGVAFLISVADGWAYRSLRVRAPTHDLGHDPLLATMVLLAIASFFRAPILIAVHRFVLLGEVTAGYRLGASDPRVRRFFGWWLSLSLMPLLPAWLVTLAGLRSQGVVLLTLSFVLLVLMIVGCFLVLRLTILLPAIAVDAPGATWRSAYQGTRGYGVRLFGIVMLAAVPLVPVFVLLVRVGHASAASVTPLDFGPIVLNSSVNVFSTVLFVAIASRIYQRIGARLNKPG
jgi:hypothetical protein